MLDKKLWSTYMANLPKKGFVRFKLVHKDKDWTTNTKNYKFGRFGDGKTFDISAFKYADRTLEIKCAWEHFGHDFSGPMPDESEVSVMVSWGKKEIKLFVNGVFCDSAPFGPSVH